MKFILGVISIFLWYSTIDKEQHTLIENMRIIKKSNDF
jgi:hypothetical protein